MFIYILFSLFFLFLLLYNNDYCKLFVQLSAANIHYLAYLPVVVKAWNRIGYCAIAIIVFHNITKDIILVKKKLKKLSCIVYMLKFNNSVSLHYSSKIARIYGFTILADKKMRRYFYLSDADILPISKKYFQDMNDNKLTIKSFDKNGYGYGNNKGRWAMCYMVANQFIWNDILKDDIKSQGLKQIITNIVESELGKGEKYFSNFVYIDEVYLRDKIRKWNKFNSNILFHKRNYKNTRIGRDFNNFKSLINNSNIIDIHLPKLTINALAIWKTKIVPLQNYLFRYIPYDISYITSLFPLS